MKARITTAAFAVAALAALGPVPHATAATGAVTCGFQGGGTTSPGVVMNATHQDYQFTGSLTCDPTSEVSSGTVTSATGAGDFGCSGGASSVDLSVTWNDNSTSTLHVDFTHVAVELAGTGSVSGGRFGGRTVVGDMLFYVGPTVDNPAAPVLEGGKCGSSPGLGAASLAGVYSILP